MCFTYPLLEAGLDFLLSQMWTLPPRSWLARSAWGSAYGSYPSSLYVCGGLAAGDPRSDSTQGTWGPGLRLHIQSRPCQGPQPLSLGAPGPATRIGLGKGNKAKDRRQDRFKTWTSQIFISKPNDRMWTTELKGTLNVLTLHCQLGRAGVLPNLHTIHALILHRHLLDDQLAIAALAADLKALWGQDDIAAFVPADTTSGVGHGAVQHDTALLQDSLILQRFHYVHRDLWKGGNVIYKED